MLTKEKWFYFVGGKTASSIEELKETLEAVDDAEFSFHVNSGKNDFANWVEGVFHKNDLADRLRHVLEREDTIAEIDRFLRRKMGEPEELPLDILPPTNFLTELDKNVADVVPEVKAPVEQDENVPEQLESLEETSEEGHDELAPPKFEDNEEIHKMVEDAKRELHHHKAHKQEDMRFIVKEFIYGFVVGLIFGLMMLGVIFNLNCG